MQPKQCCIAVTIIASLGVGGLRQLEHGVASIQSYHARTRATIETHDDDLLPQHAATCKRRRSYSRPRRMRRLADRRASSLGLLIDVRVLD